MHHEAPVHPEPINLHPAPVEPPHTLHVAPEPLKAPPKKSVHLPGEDEAEKTKEDVKDGAKQVKGEAKQQGKELKDEAEKKGKQLKAEAEKKGEQLKKEAKDVAKKAKVGVPLQGV